MAHKYPVEVIVFVVDYDKETCDPIYGVVVDASELPEEHADEIVARYRLDETCRFRLSRALEKIRRRKRVK